MVAEGPLVVVELVGVQAVGALQLLYRRLQALDCEFQLVVLADQGGLFRATDVPELGAVQFDLELLVDLQQPRNLGQRLLVFDIHRVGAIPSLCQHFRLFCRLFRRILFAYFELLQRAGVFDIDFTSHYCTFL